MRSFYEPMIQQMAAERRRQGLTQEQLNAMIGCADSLVGKWEAGMKFPSLYYLLLWAEALGMEVHLEQVDD